MKLTTLLLCSALQAQISIPGISQFNSEGYIITNGVPMAIGSINGKQTAIRLNDPECDGCGTWHDLVGHPGGPVPPDLIPDVRKYNWTDEENDINLPGGCEINYATWECKEDYPCVYAKKFLIKAYYHNGDPGVFDVLLWNDQTGEWDLLHNDVSLQVTIPISVIGCGNTTAMTIKVDYGPYADIFTIYVGCDICDFIAP